MVEPDSRGFSKGFLVLLQPVAAVVGVAKTFLIRVEPVLDAPVFQKLNVSG